MRAWLTDQPIDVQDVLGAVGSAEDGAVLVFLGTVRDHNEGRAVTGLRYDTYPEMSQQVLEELVRETARQLGTDRVAVVHRFGELAIGDISVAIAVSSPHREQAFTAARHLIEELKRRLPVWKHEQYVGGETAWVSGSVPPVRQ